MILLSVIFRLQWYQIQFKFEVNKRHLFKVEKATLFKGYHFVAT